MGDFTGKDGKKYETIEEMLAADEAWDAAIAEMNQDDVGTTGTTSPIDQNKIDEGGPNVKIVGGVTFTQRDDGKWVDDEGTVITDKEAQTGKDQTSTDASLWDTLIGKLPKDGNGNIDWTKAVGLGILSTGAVAGVKNILDGANKPAPTSGYQGGIPDLVFNRALVPSDTTRRPGSAQGLNFTGGVFSKPADSAGIMATLNQQAADRVTARTAKPAAGGTTVVTGGTGATGGAGGNGITLIGDQGPQQNGTGATGGTGSAGTVLIGDQGPQVPTGIAALGGVGGSSRSRARDFGTAGAALTVATPSPQDEAQQTMMAGNSRYTIPLDKRTAATDAAAAARGLYDPMKPVQAAYAANELTPMSKANPNYIYSLMKTASERGVNDPKSLRTWAQDAGYSLDDADIERVTKGFAAGGITSLAMGGPTSGGLGHLKGDTDGMADEVPATIDGAQPAALAHGEFVVPADVVSHLGNGNTDAGAKKLYQMLDKVRTARTGRKEQGKEINPDKFMPGGIVGLAKGGQVNFSAGGATLLKANPSVVSTFVKDIGDLYRTGNVTQAKQFYDNAKSSYNLDDEDLQPYLLSTPAAGLLPANLQTQKSQWTAPTTGAQKLAAAKPAVETFVRDIESLLNAGSVDQARTLYNNAKRDYGVTDEDMQPYMKNSATGAGFTLPQIQAFSQGTAATPTPTPTPTPAPAPVVSGAYQPAYTPKPVIPGDGAGTGFTPGTGNNTSIGGGTSTYNPTNQTYTPPPANTGLNTTAVTPDAQSSLASWAGPYVTNTLGQGNAIGNDMISNPQNYIYQGERTAGISGLQSQAFNNASNLGPNQALGAAATRAGTIADLATGMGYNPTQFGNQYNSTGAYQGAVTGANQYTATGPYQNQTATNQYQSTGPYQSSNIGNQYTATSPYQAQTVSSQYTSTAPYQNQTTGNQYTATGPYEGAKFQGSEFTQDNVQKYMNPYLQMSLTPQIDEARRQSEIQRMTNAGRLVGSGAFGGGRQALMEAEGDRNLMTNLAGITGRGYDTAYNTARDQFNTSERSAFDNKQATEASRQFGANQGLSNAQNTANFGTQAANLSQADRQFGANLGLSNAQNAANFGMQAASINNADRQFGANNALANAQNTANFGMQAANLNNADKQFGAQNALSNAQNSANFGNQAASLSQADRQFGTNAALTNAQNLASFGQQGINALEGSRQFGAQNALSNAQNMANYGTQAANSTEASKQFGAGFGINALNTALNANTQQGNFGLNQSADTRANIGLQSSLGGTQRDIQQAGLTSDMNKFNEEAALPGQAVKFKQGLLSGMPISNSASVAPQTSMITQLMQLGLTGSEIAKMFGLGTTTTGAK